MLFAASLVAILALGIVIYVTTDYGRIKIEIDDPNAVVSVDRQTVQLQFLGDPITLRAGEHDLKVKWGDGEFDTCRRFVVKCGDDRTLKIEYEANRPNDARTAQDGLPSNRDPAAAGAPATADPTKFTIVSGRWSVAGNALVQLDSSSSFQEILFGDTLWTDYDFSVDAMRTEGNSSFSVFFRSTDRKNLYDGTISGEDNKSCLVLTRDDGRYSILKRSGFRVQNNRWYTIRAHVRGRRLVCSLYDNGSGIETRFGEVEDDGHPRGQVGLQTFGAGIWFKNIKVTDPDGRVLWEGLPRVESVTTAESNGPVSQSLPPAASGNDWEPLFNGRDMAGWSATDELGEANVNKFWTVREGILRLATPGTAYVYSPRNVYSDFHLRGGQDKRSRQLGPVLPGGEGP